MSSEIMTAERLITTCSECGAPINDYASNRRKSKNGRYYCSQKCAWKGTAGAISIAHGGDGVKRTKPAKDARAYARDVEERRASRREFYRLNRDRLLAEKRSQNRALKAKIIIEYGGKCVCCGEIHHEFLTIDHTNGDGAQHRKALGKGREIYMDLKRRGFPKDGYRLMCLNCNIALGFYGYCPHHPELRRMVDKTPGKNTGRIGRPRSV